MKFCQKCGNEIMEEAVICPKCGCSTGYSPKTDMDTNGIKTVTRDMCTSGIKTIIKVFMIIGCVMPAFCCLISLCWLIPMIVVYDSMIIGYVMLSAICCLIPLCWTIPMTISYCRKIKNNEPIAISFKVCSLLFVSLVAGILMLCTED